MTYNTTPQEEQNADATTTTETHSLANEVVWSVGSREIKFWEMLVGVLILVTFIPMLFRGRRNGKK